VKYALGLVTVALVAGVSGFVAGTCAHPPLRPVASRALAVAAPAASDAPAASVTQPPVPGDYQALKNQLAICMAFHPSSEMQDKMLAMCRGDLAACRTPRDTVKDCYDFIDFAPIYDRELGEADPSPETIERARSLTNEDCVRVITWSTRARNQRSRCLEGETPPGFKERYGSMTDRPFLKACAAEDRRRDVLNAWLRREEERVREMGHEVRNRLRYGADGGWQLGPPSSVPDD
jgi:hypothetical protein